LIHRPPKGEKNPQPIVTAAERDALEAVKHDLACIRNNMAGEFIIDQAAQQFFNEWYHEHNNPAAAESYMRGYYGRKGDFLQKVAMCLSASYSDDMRVTYEDMSTALRLLNENEKYAKETVKYMGTTQAGNKHILVSNHIRRNTVVTPPDDLTSISKEDLRNGVYNGIVRSGIRHSDLMRKCSSKLLKSEIEDALDMLGETGEIKLIRLPPRNGKAYLWLGDEELV
jgi:hypothetical protein